MTIRLQHRVMLATFAPSILQIMFWSLALLLSWGFAEPARAANKIELDLGSTSVSVGVDVLENFAQTGNLSPSLEPLVKAELEDLKKQQNLDVTVTQLQKQLNRLISVNPNSIDDEEKKGLEWLKQLVPGSTDEQIKQALLLMQQQRSNQTVIDFLKAFPGESVSSNNFISAVAVYNFGATETNPPKANVIDVLWYGHNLSYNAAISQLAANASTYDPWGDGSKEWNLTMWNPSESTPNFSDYDVFVIGTGGTEFGFDFNASGILNNKNAIEAARGDRTFLSGQDADAHYIYAPGPQPNGPFGFLVNAVNWAASGQGMGIVSLADGWFPSNNPTDSHWWLNENSFLKDELEGYVSTFVEEKVIVPTETSDFPVNEGLTTEGLSNWKHSAHRSFNKTISGYISINDSGSLPGYAVTIVTASEADGGTGGSRAVPEPTFSALGLLGFGAFGIARLKRKL
ncbi:MAG: alpha/beta hydrolase [Coleofasciculus sp. S288]|nr:alpha/beta hydrolase [Coleofasciculus sp. S288]